MPDIVSPIDGRTAFSWDEMPLEAARTALTRAREAQRVWARTPLAERKKICLAAHAAYVAKLDEHAPAITRMMGRPVGQVRGEATRSMKERVEALVAMAEDALADRAITDKPGFDRRIVREPVGIVLVIAAWNYPLLVPTNALFAAVLSGNAVAIKHAHQTMPVGQQLADAFRDAGAPEGLVASLPISHETSSRLLAERWFGFVSFTGSVRGGHEVYRAAAAEGFQPVGLELGGKDAAIVLPDCDFDAAVENVVDGAFFNSGQSCCAVERALVHASIAARFTEACAALVKKYVVGDPLVEGTSLGPVVSEAGAEVVRRHVADALAKGGRRVVDPASFQLPSTSRCYVAPELIENADPRSLLMHEETFGPALGITTFEDDAEAIRLANDSPYGLTASLWTKDVERARALGTQLEVGTVFLNRCDYLDPALPWTGVKDSGSGVSLSHLGFLAVTRPKSFHFRLP
jgi:acyl-CoA reductase-like NAD-dependent aldehyde dehydrogenase